MAVTENDILALGFTAEMFPTTSDFSAFLVGKISAESALLSGRIGAALYATTAEPKRTYIHRAEERLVAAELVQVRITTMMGNAIPDGEIDPTTTLRKQRKDFLDEAETLIEKILSGSDSDSVDYSGGVVIHGD